MCFLDVSLLTMLVTSDKHDDQPVAILSAIHSKSGTHVNPQFEKAGSDRFPVSSQTIRQAQ